MVREMFAQRVVVERAAWKQKDFSLVTQYAILCLIIMLKSYEKIGNKNDYLMNSQVSLHILFSILNKFIDFLQSI